MKTSTKIHDVPRIDGTSIAVIRAGSSTREGDRKILLDDLVVDTDDVCGIVRGSAIDGVLLVSDSASMVGPARNLISEPMICETGSRNSNEGMAPSCTVELQAVQNNLPSKIYLPAAGALQADEQETSRVVSGIDTTSRQLIADLIAKGRRQIRVPREHPPRPEFSTRF